MKSTSTSLADRVGALLVGEAALLLARIQAVCALNLVRARRPLLARHTVVEARKVFPVLLCAIRFVLLGWTNRVGFDAVPYASASENQ